MPGERANAAAEVLLGRLRRLTARTAVARSGDRGQLLALLDDVETTRRGLLQACAEIEDEMRRATVRTTAIGAYLRGAQAGGRRHN
jgi:hypothetical protein